MKTTPLKIVVLGSGNVATQLSLTLKEAKHTILQVYSKQKSNADNLAKKLKCPATASISKINQHADLYIMAINDDAIKSFASKLSLNNKILLHTSGNVEMNVLKKVTNNIGVFYPLQTIHKSKKINFSNIPICLEANNSTTLKVLRKLAKSISNTIYLVNSDQRKQIHLAAVFACNFSNHLYIIAERILKKNNLPLNILFPLIEETTNKIKHQSPALLQTGPAIRGDNKVMQEHIKLLGNNKDLVTLYKLISKQIAQK